jgi:hypothetical protein
VSYQYRVSEDGCESISSKYRRQKTEDRRQAGTIWPYPSRCSM